MDRPEAIAAEGATARGLIGQVVAHPAVPATLQLQTVCTRLVQAMDLAPVEDEVRATEAFRMKRPMAGAAGRHGYTLRSVS